MTIMLIGINRKTAYLVFIGALLAALSRPTFSVLIPAVFVILTIKVIQQNGEVKSTIYSLISPIVVGSLIGFNLVNLLEYQQTGVWWAMIKAQECWDHGFHAFHFPMLSWGSDLIHRVDGILMAAGLTISTFIIYWFVQVFVLKKEQKLFSNIDLLSLLFIAGTAFTLFLFQKDTHSGNRYFICTPFALLVIVMWHKSRLQKKDLIIWTFVYFLFSSLFGAYSSIKPLLIYLIGFLVLLGINKVVSLKKWRWLYTLLIMFLLVVQGLFIYKFMNGEWIA
jgi:hypothetical protein